jgi:hypothetical protein
MRFWFGFAYYNQEDVKIFVGKCKVSGRSWTSVRGGVCELFVTYAVKYCLEIIFGAKVIRVSGVS